MKRPSEPVPSWCARPMLPGSFSPPRGLCDQKMSPVDAPTLSAAEELGRTPLDGFAVHAAQAANRPTTSKPAEVLRANRDGIAGRSLSRFLALVGRPIGRLHAGPQGTVMRRPSPSRRNPAELRGHDKDYPVASRMRRYTGKIRLA